MNERVWLVLQIIFAAAVSVNIALTGWIVTNVIDLREAQASMQADRFTSSDGLAVWQEIASIRTDIATNASIPTPEVIRWLERHDREIQELQP